MKKYRLKKWYPSLDNDFEVGDIVFYDKERGCYAKPNNRDTVLRKREVENNPDFWELIEEVKQPLFVTDDGVELFDEADKVFIVNKECYKKESEISNIYDKTNRKDFKYFFHESSADEYIWRNKRVFNYEDMMKAKHSIILTNEDIEKAAIERSKQ